MHQVGKNIDSWCSKCNLMLAHTIEAMDKSVVKKVHCNTCKAVHVHRPNPPNSKTKDPAAAKSTKAAGKVKAPRSAGEYAKLMENVDERKTREYSFKGIYDQGDVINHGKFGLGYVMAQKDSSKIEVLFSEGLKLLVQGRG